MQKKLLHFLSIVLLAAMSFTASAQTPTGCVAPVISAVTADSTKATVTWSLNSTTTMPVTYTLEYTIAPATSTSVWTSLAVTPTPGTLPTATVTGLNTCTVYLFRVKTNCSATSSSVWSTVRDTKTKGCVVTTPCTAPVIGTVTADSTKVTLTWSSANTVPVPSYTVQYTKAPQTSTSVWTSVTVTGTTTTISGLDVCTGYLFRVKANCSATSSSDWSAIRDPKTKGCVVVTPCTAPVIGTVTADTTKATLTWSSAGAPVAASYTVEYTKAPQTNTSVWTSVTVTGTTTTINGLDACTGYLFRVKANCSATSSSAWSALRDTKTKGCVVVTPCTAPVIGTVTADTTKATLTWSSAGAAPAASYTVEYTKVPQTSTSVWTSVTVTGTTTTINGLDACTGYLFRVKANCSATSSSAWSALRDTKTKGCVVVTPCTAPVIGTVTADTTKATLTWSSAGAPVAASYTVEYTKAPQTNTSVWTSVTVTGTTTTINGLDACTGYLFRVKANCSATSSSAWSALRDTKTKGCVVVTPCTAPVIGTVTADTTKATLTWSSAGTAPAASYTVEYTKAPQTSTSVWTSVTVTGTTTTINGLDACTGYLFRVKANCSATSSSAWSALRDTKTKGCVVVTPCTAPVIGTVTADTTKATLTWSSAGAPVAASYTVEYTKAPQTNTSVWTSVTVTGTTTTINGLDACTGYLFRVKANCSATSSSAWSALRDTKTKGCVVVTPCTAPVIGTVTADTTKATLTWSSAGTAPAASYTVEYTKVPQTNTSVWTSVTVTGTTTTINGLSTCTGYLFRVKANCSATSSSAWSALRDTRTKGCPVITPCVKPTNLTSTVTKTSATLSWNGAGVAQVRYLVLTNTVTTVMIDSITNNTITLNNLTPCKPYLWQVRVKCSNNTWTPWTDYKVFNTNCTRPAAVNNATIAPNPGNYFNLTYTIEQEANVTVDVLDLQGRIVKHIDAGKQYAGQNVLNVEDLDIQAGMYFITLKADGVQQLAERWIKE